MPKPAKRKVAIFDIDGTIFRSSLLIEVVEALIAKGIFPVRIRKTYQEAFERWQNRLGSYDDYIQAVVAAFERHIRGVRSDDFIRISREVIAFRSNRVYRYTRDLVRELDRKGYFLLAISHSPREVVYEFCRRLGFDKVYARIYEVDGKGRFTGETMYRELINNKDKVLERAVLTEELTLRGSVGVGDTDSDIPFLRLVERPICFNPNARLFAQAKKAGWSVVVERKDVIYRIGE
jgi:HAD superfamily hydrolase (TIGR01490 family)